MRWKQLLKLGSITILMAACAEEPVTPPQTPAPATTGGTGGRGPTATGGAGGAGVARGPMTPSTGGTGGGSAVTSGGRSGTPPVTGTGGMGAPAVSGNGGGAAGSSAGAGGGMAAADGPLTIQSEALKDGADLDPMYRCMSLQMSRPSPAISWSGGSADAKSYALVMQDRSNNLYHWVIFDIPASTKMLPMGVELGAMPAAPMGAKQATNGLGMPGYLGPCGQTKNPYEFTVYALDVDSLPMVMGGSQAMAVVAQIQMHDLASAKLTVMSGP